MENIEGKLKNYRLRKRRQEIIQNIKAFLMFSVNGKTGNEPPDTTTLTINDSETEEYLPTTLSSSKEVVDEDEDCSDEIVCDDDFKDSESLYFQYILRLVYVALWITLYIIAIELQFGIVFLMFSALFGIYINTRTGPRKINEVSAYSVFNRNCESIDGTLKAEQFEREMGLK